MFIYKYLGRVPKYQYMHPTSVEDNNTLTSENSYGGGARDNKTPNNKDLRERKGLAMKRVCFEKIASYQKRGIYRVTFAASECATGVLAQNPKPIITAKKKKTS